MDQTAIEHALNENNSDLALNLLRQLSFQQLADLERKSPVIASALILRGWWHLLLSIHYPLFGQRIAIEFGKQAWRLVVEFPTSLSMPVHLKQGVKLTRVLDD